MSDQLDRLGGGVLNACVFHVLHVPFVIGEGHIFSDFVRWKV